MFPSHRPYHGFKRRIGDFLAGVHYRIPPCCIVRFVFHRGDERQACLRGVAGHGDDRYVPCGAFHRANLETATEVMELNYE